MASDFLTADFELQVRELTRQAQNALRMHGSDRPRIAGFAYNCSSAWGDLHISLTFSAERAISEPPNWEHEALNAETPSLTRLWRERYEPFRVRYEAARATQPEHAAAFLHGLRGVLAKLDCEGAFRDHQGIRLVVTEVDADTEAERAALAHVRAQAAAERCE